MPSKRKDYNGPVQDRRGVYHGRGGKTISTAQAAEEILAKTNDEEYRPYRERLFQQRLSSAEQASYARGHDEPRKERYYNRKLGKYVTRTIKPFDYSKVRFDRDRDLRLQLFARTPREKRTKAQWKQFRKDYHEIYGNEREDGGEYY